MTFLGWGRVTCKEERGESCKGETRSARRGPWRWVWNADRNEDRAVCSFEGHPCHCVLFCLMARLGTEINVVVRTKQIDFEHRLS